MTQKTSGGEPTFEVDSPEQYNAIPNDTYFKDNFLGIKLYKSETGQVINPWATEWVKQRFDFTESEVRAMQSLNDSYGDKIYDKPGENIIKQLTNAILNYNGSIAIDSDDAEWFIYAVKNRGEEDEAIAMILASVAMPTTDPAIFPLTSAGISASKVVINNPSYLADAEIFLYPQGAGIHLEAFSGTASLILDYRELDLS